VLSAGDAMKRTLSLVLLAVILASAVPVLAQAVARDTNQTQAHKKRKHRRHKNHHKGHIQRDAYPSAQ